MFAGAHVVLASEALLMAKKAGIDMGNYFDAVRNSAGNSCTVTIALSRVPGGYW